MYRLWGKIIKKNAIIESYVSIIDNPNIDDAEKLKLALSDICLHFDIQMPIWFQDNQIDILKYSKTNFKQDHFMESINYDYLEIDIIEVDKV